MQMLGGESGVEGERSESWGAGGCLLFRLRTIRGGVRVDSK